MVDVCCLQQVRLRRQRYRMLWMEGRFKMWWFGNRGKVGGVGVMVKEELR